MKVENYLTVAEAAQLLGVSNNTVRAWGASGKITEYRHPVNNYRLFDRDELDRLYERIRNPKPTKRRRPKPK